MEKEFAKSKPQSEVTPASTIFEEETEHAAVARNVEPKTGTVVEKDGEKVYQGSVALDILPPVNSKQIASLEKLLLGVPYIRLMGKGGTDSGKSWFGVEITEPLPLRVILESMPPVKEVFEYGKTITVKLKA